MPEVFYTNVSFCVFEGGASGISANTTWGAGTEDVEIWARDSSSITFASCWDAETNS